jgi:C4-dicarboxylate-specific signal transduction histidine kinase
MRKTFFRALIIELRKFRVYWRRDKWLRTLSIMGSLFIVLAAVVYRLALIKTGQTLEEQIFQRGQVVTRAGAQTIESFMELIGHSLVFLTNNQKITAMGSSAQQKLDEFVAEWQTTPLVGIALVDKEGTVLENANNLGIPPEVGASLFAADWFQDALQLKQGEFSVGAAKFAEIGATKGQVVVPIYAPVFEAGKMKGVLVVVVLFSEVVEKYLEPLKISGESQVILVNQQGSLLYSSNPQLRADNLFDYLKMHSEAEIAPVLEGFNQTFLTKSEVTAKGFLPRISGEGWQEELLSYAPVQLERRDWVLVLATPAIVVHLFTAGLRTGLSFTLILLLLIILLASCVLIFIGRVIQRDAYEDGFVDGHRVKKQK